MNSFVTTRKHVIDRCCDEEGSLTIVALLFFVVMIMVGGIAVDIMVFENNRTRLQNLADRAVLAAADMEQQNDAKGVVESYFDKAGEAEQLRDVKVLSNANEKSVSVITDKPTRTMFMNLTGVEQMTPRATSTAAESITDIEISLVLDVSGSMNRASSTGGTKIDELKKSAKQFIDKIYNTPRSDRITVSLIPYSTQVNAGAEIYNLVQRNALGQVRKDHDKSYCMAFLSSDFNDTNIRTGGVYQHTAHFDPFYGADGEDPVLRVCRPGTEQEIKPIQSDPDVIKGQIDALQANGNTSIEIGLKWGAALLDPSFQPLAATMSAGSTIDEKYKTRPFAWDRDNTAKHVVLLTDGINTTQTEVNPEYSTGLSPMWRLVDDQEGDFYAIDVTAFDPDAVQQFWIKGGSYQDITWPDTSTDDLVAGIADIFGDDLTNLLGGPVVPTQMTWQEVWNELRLKHLGEAYIEAATGSDTKRQEFYNDALRFVTRPMKNAQVQNLCTQLGKNATIYTIGLEVTDASAAVLADCASVNGTFIRVVKDKDNLQDAFNAIAASINALKLIQ